MIKVLTGDILASPMQAKVNTVNCVGIMGKGIAQLFKAKYPDMFDDYRDRCKAGEVEEGIPYVYSDIFGNKIVNFPTKKHWKGLSNLESIQKGLDIFIQNYKDWGIESVAFPPLGCGNGGLLWQVVGPIMYQKLSTMDIPIEIYAPFGTDRKYLSPEFLSIPPNQEIKAQIRDKDIPPSWFAILEIVHRLGTMPYTVPVGKTVFQKLCFAAELLGLNTGLVFTKGTYGPYSKDIDRMYLVLGRENLIKETQHQNHTKIETGMQYPPLREKMMPYLQQHENQISQIVDIFSRIKSAIHAEEIGTILYALSKLTDTKDIVSEMDFYRYIMNWKKQWDTPEKRESIASTIRYLATKGWVRMEYSEDLLPDY